VTYFSVINAASHAAVFFKSRYNPGLVVSLLLNVPPGIFTIYYLAAHGRRGEVEVGVTWVTASDLAP
jgi:hypothetical protein